MKSIAKFLGAAASLTLAAMGTAYAAVTVTVPEPGSIALVALGIAGVVAFRRRK